MTLLKPMTPPIIESYQPSDTLNYTSSGSFYPTGGLVPYGTLDGFFTDFTGRDVANASLISVVYFAQGPFRVRGEDQDRNGISATLITHDGNSPVGLTVMSEAIQESLGHAIQRALTQEDGRLYNGSTFAPDVCVAFSHDLGSRENPDSSLRRHGNVYRDMVKVLTGADPKKLDEHSIGVHVLENRKGLPFYHGLIPTGRDLVYRPFRDDQFPHFPYDTNPESDDLDLGAVVHSAFQKIPVLGERIQA